MAAIISISSDEEQSDDSITPPAKKPKVDLSIIYLDDEEDKSKLIENDVVIESHDEITRNNNRNGDKKHTNNKVESKTHTHIQHKTAENPSKEKNDKLNNTSPEDDHKNSETATTSTQDNIAGSFDGSEKMQTFINICLSQITNKETKDLFKSKVPFCKKLFDKIDEDYIKSDTFDEFLEEHIKLSKSSSMDAIKSFNDIYQHLKNRRHSENSDVDVSDKKKLIIAKLEHALKKVQRVLMKLEESEVDFDEEEDSSYIKMQRYRERAVKIYEKICKYKNEDANAHNILYNRLDFSGSNYAEFNHIINKKFKNNTVFPTYYEVERYLRKTAKDKNMNLSENQLKQEARECFKNLGNLLQKRRRIDLLSVHSCYLATNDDPAFENEELSGKLKANFKEANSKIDEICAKYVKMQDSGVNPNVSSDSDDSHKASTEEEDNVE